LLQSLVEIVQAVEATKRIKIDAPKAITFFSVNDQWVYTAIYDNVACDLCLSHEHVTYTGDQLRTLFPYLEIADLDLIYPHVHPNCRCQLERVLYYGDIGKEIP